MTQARIVCQHRPAEAVGRYSGHPSDERAAGAGSATAVNEPSALGRSQAFLLLTRASHPRAALLTAAGLALAAEVSGRPPRETALVLVTVLVGQAILGSYLDLTTRERDRASGDPRKPLATGEVDAGDAWFAIVCAALLVVPLSLSNGISAGSCYLVSVAVGLVGGVVLRRRALSFLPWAAAYALYPAFLSYGGWGGRPAAPSAAAPVAVMVVLAALLGIGVHMLRALPDLLADHAVGARHLPLRIALRTGATRLLVLASVWTGLVAAGLLVAAVTVGLRR